MSFYKETMYKEMHNSQNKLQKISGEVQNDIDFHKLFVNSNNPFSLSFSLSVFNYVY